MGCEEREENEERGEGREQSSRRSASVGSAPRRPAHLRVEEIASFMGEVLLEGEREMVLDVGVGQLMSLDEAARVGEWERSQLGLLVAS